MRAGTFSRHVRGILRPVSTVAWSLFGILRVCLHSLRVIPYPFVSADMVVSLLSFPSPAVERGSVNV